MSINYEAAQITGSFKLICRKCNSENVVVDVECGNDYGDETGYEPGHISIGCNDCKQNDVHVYVG